MASACVNNMGVSPESFTAAYPSYGWLGPRIPFTRELPNDNDTEHALNENDNNDNQKSSSSSFPSSPPAVKPADDLPPLDPADFEFHVEDPVAMLPADKLFSDGKLVPLHLSAVKLSSSAVNDPALPETRRGSEISSGSHPYLFSPKAPRCSSRWRELLGLKRFYNNTNNNNPNNNPKTASFSSACSSSSSSTISSSNSSKSLKLFLHRSSKWSSSSLSSSSSSSSDSLPLLKDTDCESVSLSSSSRLSLSSSSSGGHEHDDLPRHSLDSDKPTANIPISLQRNPNNPPPPRMRVVKQRSSVDHPATAGRAGRSPIRRLAGESSTSRGVSVDSPRMNSSGKIVFQSLERSSSSPSSFNGGPRFKHRGMERSYSANVRIPPVLNVPVCSLRGSSKSGSVFGFGQLFSSPQKRSEGNNNGSGGGGSNRSHGHGRAHNKNRTERNCSNNRPNRTENK